MHGLIPNVRVWLKRKHGEAKYHITHQPQVPASLWSGWRFLWPRGGAGTKCFLRFFTSVYAENKAIEKVSDYSEAVAVTANFEEANKRRPGTFYRGEQTQLRTSILSRQKNVDTHIYSGSLNMSITVMAVNPHTPDHFQLES